VKVRDLVRLLESNCEPQAAHRTFQASGETEVGHGGGKIRRRRSDRHPQDDPKRLWIGGKVSIRYSVIYEKGPSSWGASVPDLPGCVAVGANRQEVETLIREAIEAHLDALRECGIAVPEPRHEIGEVEITAA